MVSKFHNETHDPYTMVNTVIAYAHMPLINAHDDASGKPRGLIFGWDLYLHLYFVYASSEGLPITRAAFIAQTHRVWVKMKTWLNCRPLAALDTYAWPLYRHMR